MYHLPLRYLVQPLLILAICFASIASLYRHAITFFNKLNFCPKYFIWFLYCQILNGPWCGHGENHAPVSVHTLVSVVAPSATSASDIFQSVANLAEPYSLRLHQVEILELALAIECSPTFEGNTVLAGLVWQFGDVTREVKDSLGFINSKAINTFSIIGLEVCQ